MSEYTQQLLSVTDLGKMLRAKGSTIRGYLERMGVKPAYAYSGRLSVYNLSPPEYEELKRRVEYLRRRPAGTSPRRRGDRTTPEQASLGLAETTNQAGAQPDHIFLAFNGIAMLLATEGDRKRAVELLSMTMNHRGSWQIVKDQAAWLLAKLETELPPEVAQAAQERGRSRNLETTVQELLAESGEGRGE